MTPQPQHIQPAAVRWRLDRPPREGPSGPDAPSPTAPDGIASALEAGMRVLAVRDGLLVPAVPGPVTG
ncbi:hypothetical protein [Kitasatospora sp. NPDC088134]|uniref:hypothetical protein n=1 Tax=Kitasatospora sp. NPDC088134 TaxID=3364071 RepID=UPI003814D132